MAAEIATLVASVVGEVLEDVEEIGIPSWTRELTPDERAACKLRWPGDKFKYVVVEPQLKAYTSEVAGRLEVPIPVGFLTDGVSGGIDIVNFTNACAHDYMYAGGKVLKNGAPFKPSKAVADEVLSLAHRRVAVRCFGNGAWTSGASRGIPCLQDLPEMDLSASSTGLPKFAEDDADETSATESWESDSESESGQEMVD